MENRKLRFGVILLLSIIIFVVFTPLFFEEDAYSFDFDNVMEAPSLSHLLGTDYNGRDILLRCALGGRVSLSFAFIATAFTIIIALFLSFFTIHRGFDIIIMRICEVLQTIPMLPFVMIISYLLIWIDPIIKILIISIILGVLNAPSLVRIIRIQYHTLMNKDFVLAAKLLGASNFYIVRKHLLKNTYSYIGVYAVELFVSMLLLEVSLSFLGLGVTPPYPSWGNIMNSVSQGSAFINYPWIWIPAGILCFMSALSTHLIKEGIQVVIQPKSNSVYRFDR